MESKYRTYIAIATAAMLLLLAAAYYFFDPMETGWMPRCLWKTVTGTDCPGCGTQRMAHALMHGEFVKAWYSNAFALCMIPVIIFYVWLELNAERHNKLYRSLHSPWIINLFIFSILCWWVIRNIIVI
ncbi:MAG: DUF2752 domain-containing protein [Muribaculum sp.]|nr:DUF2752 domain-containing protein [Muribaculum sp.]